MTSAVFVKRSTIAVAFALLLSACAPSLGPQYVAPTAIASVDLEGGVPTYLGDGGQLLYVTFDDGTVKYYRTDGTLLKVTMPNGDEVTYEDDGLTVKWTILANGIMMLPGNELPQVDVGARLVDDGVQGTVESPAPAGSIFRFIDGGQYGDISFIARGFVDGTYPFTPASAGDSGTCYITYFQFKVESFGDSGKPYPIDTFYPPFGYRVDGRDYLSQQDLTGSYDGQDSLGFCSEIGVSSSEDGLSELFAYNITTPAELETLHHGYSIFYVPEGMHLDSIVLTLRWVEGSSVYFEINSLDEPMVYAFGD